MWFGVWKILKISLKFEFFAFFALPFSLSIKHHTHRRHHNDDSLIVTTWTASSTGIDDPIEFIFVIEI